jgi:hypothetical protein
MNKKEELIIKVIGQKVELIFLLASQTINASFVVSEESAKLFQGLSGQKIEHDYLNLKIELTQEREYNYKYHGWLTP